jgi:PAS domain S-box-containing protein
VLEVVTRELAGGGIVRTYADVTEQQEVHQKLRDSELRFRSLTQLSSDWYWLQDENFRFIKFEGEREQKTRRLEAVDLGQTRWEIGAENMSEDDWEVHRRALQAHQAFRELELERRTPDGNTYWISISGEPIFDEDEVFRGYRGIGCDITSRKLAEAQIERLAFYDALTGLPIAGCSMTACSRRWWLACGARAWRPAAHRSGQLQGHQRHPGHDVGDELLKQAERLSRVCARPTRWRGWAATSSW